MLAKATLVLHPVSHEWDQCCLDKKITSPLRDRAMANIANCDMTKCLCWLQLRMGYTIKDFLSGMRQKCLNSAATFSHE